jgi:sugar lactone lactonase YvrE
MRWLLALGWWAPSCAKNPEPTDRCSAGDVCIEAGTGELGFNGDDLGKRDTRLASPSAVYEHPEGRIVIVDYSNMRVREVTESGAIQTVVGNGFHAYSEPGATPLETPLENPVDIGWNPDGQLCVLPQHEGRVICLNGDGLIERYAGTGIIGDAGDDGPALDADIGYGGGMVFAEDGTLYVSDSTHSRVRRIRPDGTIDTALGTGEAGLGEPGFGPETAIRFPERLAYDETNQRLLVADAHNHRVLSVDAESLAVQWVAGTGEAGFSGDGGPATDAMLNQPMGVAVDADGGILIADTRNHVIRRIDPAGAIDTLVGTGADHATTDRASFDDFSMVGPAGLSWTAAGDLLIAEHWGHRILRARDLVSAF